MLATVFAGLFSTALLHDLAGWSELASAVPLLAALVVAVAVVLWLVYGPLRDLPAKEALLARYRALQAMGLPLEVPASVREEDTSALGRLVQRIAVLAQAAQRPEVVEAAQAAQAHAGRLEQELGHLDAMVAEQPALAAQLAGVRERLEGEVARTRARLAETYAALLALEVGPGEGTAALEDAVLHLQADAEVASAAQRAAQRVPTR